MHSVVHLTKLNICLASNLSQIVGAWSGKTTAPGEMRAPSIEGGSRRKISAGDVVHIPAKVAHQVLLDSGGKFDYMVVKVKQ